MKNIFIKKVVFVIAMLFPLKFLFSSESITINFLGDSDRVVKGVFVEKDFWFELSPQWNFVKTGELNLIISHSPILIPSISTLTVSMNNTPLTSLFLTKDNLYNTLIKIPVPIRILREDMNKLSFTAKMRSQDDDFCEDVYNPAIWLTIHKETHLKLIYEEKIVEPDLSLFPESYTNPELLYKSPKERIHCILFLPEDPLREEIEVMAIVSALLGRSPKISYGGLKVWTSSKAKLQDLQNYHIIVIGNYNFIKNLTSPPWSLPINIEFLKNDPFPRMLEIPSPFNYARRLIVLTGRDNKSLEILTKNLKVLSSIKELKGAGHVFESVPEEETSTEASPLSAFGIRLMDLKMSDIHIKGKFYHSTEWTIPNPYAGKIKEGAFFRISMSHSEVLLPDTSSILLKINGEPIKSIRLTVDNAHREYYDIKIPKHLLKSRFFNFELELFLDIGDPDCRYDHPEMAWFTLHNDSLLYLPIDVGKEYSLSNYPHLFMLWNKFDALNLLLEDKPGSAELTLTANILAYLSQSLFFPEKIDTNILTLSQLNEEIKKKNNFIIISRLGSVLNIEGLKDIVPSEIIETSGVRGPKTLSSILQKSGFIYLARSPWNITKHILLVTGNGIEEIKRASLYLYQSDKIPLLNGYLGMVMENGIFKALLPPIREASLRDFDVARIKFKEEKGEKIPVIEPPKPLSPPSKHNIAYLLFFLLTPLIILLVILRIKSIKLEEKKKEK